MNDRALELALRKQRLQDRSAALRHQWAADSTGLEAFCRRVDRIAAGLAWLRRHPQVPVAVTVALLVARPKAVFRWLRRGFVAWQMWRRLRSWFYRRPAVT